MGRRRLLNNLHRHWTLSIVLCLLHLVCLDWRFSLLLFFVSSFEKARPTWLICLFFQTLDILAAIGLLSVWTLDSSVISMATGRPLIPLTQSRTKGSALSNSTPRFQSCYDRIDDWLFSFLIRLRRVKICRPRIYRVRRILTSASHCCRIRSTGSRPRSNDGRSTLAGTRRFILKVTSSLNYPHSQLFPLLFSFFFPLLLV